MSPGGEHPNRVHVENGKLTLSTDGWSALERLIESVPALSNAFRLMNDATLLFDFERYASVVALAVIAIEEIGKYLLATWSDADAAFQYDRRRLHIMKQSAVAALFITERSRREYIDAGFDFSQLDCPEKIVELVGYIKVGMEKERHFANAVINKAVEKAKWSGLYYDDEFAEKGIEPSNITADDARSVMESLSKALMCLADSRNIAIAKATFGFFYAPKK